MVERISDLEHASELAKKSPREARKLLLSISSQLASHNDNEFAKVVDEASRVVMDNPAKAMSVIGSAISQMLSDKEDHDAETEAERSTAWLKRK
jgi:hypothetical protein